MIPERRRRKPPNPHFSFYKTFSTRSLLQTLARSPCLSLPPCVNFPSCSPGSNCFQCMAENKRRKRRQSNNDPRTTNILAPKLYNNSYINMIPQSYTVWRCLFFFFSERESIREGRHAGSIGYLIFFKTYSRHFFFLLSLHDYFLFIVLLFFIFFSLLFIGLVSSADDG
ncbi:hypothetical protein B0T20DRAFT_148912 [Sordaria brevicollis]|uniref:Transmembrane protein n=1 Tax=Sordaria brevicollis TaxID=83679 RepID=A0AAE0PIR1_SORBR|nr:hypothetical protein B0T20DRAFT_148912 [Sordaria brevicollis]